MICKDGRIGSLSTHCRLQRGTTDGLRPEVPDVICWGRWRVGQWRGKGVCLASGSRVNSLSSSLLSGLAHVSVLHNLSEGHSVNIYHNKQCVCSSGPALTSGIPTNAASRRDVETFKCPSTGDLVRMTAVHPQLSNKALQGKGQPPTPKHTHLDGFQGYYAEGKDQSQGHGCMISSTYILKTPCW